MSIRRPTTAEVARAEWPRLLAASLLTVASSIGLWTIVSAIDGDPPLRIAVPAGAVFGVIAGALLPGLLARDWAEAGGRDARLAYRDALRTHRLPPDADDETWYHLIDRTEQESQGATFRVIGFSVVAALNVVAAVTSGGVGSVGQWSVVAVFTGMAVAAGVQRRPRQRAVVALRARLRERARASGPGASESSSAGSPPTGASATGGG